MKRYLITAAMAIAVSGAFVSCHDDEFSGSKIEQKKEAFAEAFISAFGQPNPNHTWGFGNLGNEEAITRSNPGPTYPYTHSYSEGGANCNANEWADPTKGFGGWIVPDPLTEGQKLRVKLYFQTHPNLGYEDPHLRHFFVQQVYKGKTDPYTTSTEEVIAADGSKYDSDNMNQLTVGQSNMHINNFNSGDATELDVLKNGESVGGATQKDKIMLMVNIDDTSCFGYHDSGSSNQSSASPNHNDKMALASAQDIDDWANSAEAKALFSDLGEPVVDNKWNRSFMGFDLAIKEGTQAYATDDAGNVLYATCNEAPGQPAYAWDGERITQIINPSIFLRVAYLTTNKNFYIEASKVTLGQTSPSLNGGKISDQNWDDIKDYVVFDDAYVDANHAKVKVLNLKRINELISQKYLPVMSKSLQEWVQVGKSDGYFSDWIVTLTEAKRSIVDPTIPYVILTGTGTQKAKVENYKGKRVAKSGRVMCEDLTLRNRDDFDFNDIVFDVVIIDEYTRTVITPGTLSGDTFTPSEDEVPTESVSHSYYANVCLLAAGGTIPATIEVDGHTYDVHNMLGKQASTTMINTLSPTQNSKVGGASVVDDIPPVHLEYKDENNVTTRDFKNVDDFLDVKVFVRYENDPVQLVPVYGQPSPIFVAPLGTRWPMEQTNISLGYKGFSDWVSTEDNGFWNLEIVDDNLHANIVGLTIPEDGIIMEEILDGEPTYEDVSTSTGRTYLSADGNSVMLTPGGYEEILLNYDPDDPSYLAPATSPSAEDELKVELRGYTNAAVGDKVRIYGVFLNNWKINTNISNDEYTAYTSDGFVEIELSNAYLNNMKTGLVIQGMNFTVTYVTIMKPVVDDAYWTGTKSGDFDFPISGKDLRDNNLAVNSIVRFTGKRGQYYCNYGFHEGQNNSELNGVSVTPYWDTNDFQVESNGHIDVVFTTQTAVDHVREYGFKIAFGNFTCNKVEIINP